MEYSFFVKKVQEYAATGIESSKAVCMAVQYCIENNIMKEFMEVHRGEVENMFTEEFDYDRAMEISKEEGRIEEVKKLIKAGITNLATIKASGIYTPNEIAAIAAG